VVVAGLIDLLEYNESCWIVVSAREQVCLENEPSIPSWCLVPEGRTVTTGMLFGCFLCRVVVSRCIPGYFTDGTDGTYGRCCCWQSDLGPRIRSRQKRSTTATLTTGQPPLWTQDRPSPKAASEEETTRSEAERQCRQSLHDETNNNNTTQQKHHHQTIVTYAYFTCQPSPQTAKGPSLLTRKNAHRSLIEATVPGGMLWFAVAMDRACSLLAWKPKRTE
jgi:hypothetical protein